MFRCPTGVEHLVCVVPVPTAGHASEVIFGERNLLVRLLHLIDRGLNTEHVEALFTRVNDDPELQTRFKAIADETEFDALVSELGYDLTYADFAEAADNAELTDEQLADIAGGDLIAAAVIGGGILISGAVAGGLTIAHVTKKWG